MRIISRLADLKLLELRGSEVSLTAHGENRARDIVRRRRLAERLLTDTFSIADSEADSHACKFEHIISPELDQRICAFLGHPQTCPHGNPDSAGPLLSLSLAQRLCLLELRGCRYHRMSVKNQPT